MMEQSVGQAQPQKTPAFASARATSGASGAAAAAAAGAAKSQTPPLREPRIPRRATVNVAIPRVPSHWQG